MPEEDPDTDVLSQAGVTHREGALGSRRPTKEQRLPRGASVGRYLILDVLGEGGMGVVYAAFDPELDRRVAIKLLQATAAGGSRGDQAWLVREAQALARVSHPNVIEVHDVGTLPGDRVFVAMELVEGVPLRTWMKQPRPWREVLAMMRGAGAGLAAVHAAGLVHRDFKPENIIVGTDGRARLMDFGLARPTATPSSAPAARTSDLDIDTKSPLQAELTIAGSVVGTPNYMAPELYDGKPADALTDQFAFGVTLFEALYRMRPYEKAQLVAERTTTPVPSTPPSTIDVPAALDRVARRAISPDRGARYSSMDDLLGALAIDPARRRRMIMFAAAAVVVIGAATTFGFVLSKKTTQTAVAPAPPRCVGIASRLAGVWDSTIKSSVEKSFTGKRSFATQMFVTASTALDVYAAEWTAATTENCEATRVRGDQPDDVMALRQTCLDDRLEELGAVTKLLADADASLVDKADKAAWALEPVKRCANIAALRAPVQPPPAIAGKIASIRTRLSSAKALTLAGRYDPAIAASTSALDDARAIDYAPLVAETALVRGAALMQVRKNAEAAATLAEAEWAAVRGKTDLIAASAAFTAALNAATGLAKTDEAKFWLDLGTAVAARSPNERELELSSVDVAGIIAGERGDFVTAIAAHEKALALATQIYDKDRQRIWKSEYSLAATYGKNGAWSDAIPHFESALALRETSVGPDHPDGALMLSSLGATYAHVGETAKARANFTRALAIRERAFGESSPVLIATLNNIADLAREEKQFPDAYAAILRAQNIAEKAPGPKHPLYHTVVTTLGEIQLAEGKYEVARKTLDALIATEIETKSPMLSTTLSARAELALADHRFPEAIDLAKRAIALFEAAGGKDSADLYRPLAQYGRALVAQNKLAEAKPLLERAIALGDKAKVKAADLAPARDALAKIR